MTKLQGIRHVVLPQGLRFAIPGWTNEFVYLFRRARDIGADTFQFTDIYVIVAAFYLVLTTAMAMGRVESWIAIPGLILSDTSNTTVRWLSRGFCDVSSPTSGTLVHELVSGSISSDGRE